MQDICVVNIFQETVDHIVAGCPELAKAEPTMTQQSCHIYITHTGASAKSKLRGTLIVAAIFPWPHTVTEKDDITIL